MAGETVCRHGVETSKLCVLCRVLDANHYDKTITVHPDLYEQIKNLPDLDQAAEE